jgi:nitroimidazol reductase NimA-like FMN-containing flavoprotein (pyridoxamine 5'-phosphate oxidase superfamily)
MDSRELKAELEPAEELLRTATLARLAYNGVDETPRVIPIGFLWTGDAVVLATHRAEGGGAALAAAGGVDDRHREPAPLPAAPRRG